MLPQSGFSCGACAVRDASAVKDLISPKVFLEIVQKSIPTQIRQSVLHISDSKGQVDGFVGGVTSDERL